jgi:flagellar biosynthesis protein
MTPPNRTKKRTAVALSYKSEADPAPRVTATGQGTMAERIIELAKENGLPIREDPDLAAALSALDLGATIPVELYGVIAEVLAWSYKVNGDYAARGRAG